MRWGRIAVTCLFGLAACRELPELAHDVCGNGVVEPGEDCDGAAGANLVCAAPEAAAACRYLCNAARCPAGWACGDDGVCRYGSGELIAEPPIAFAHDQLAIGDVDGDRLGDIVAFDSRGAHVMFEGRTAIVASPDELTGPGIVDDLDGDGLADIVAPIGQGLAIGRGEVDRTVTPASYAPFLAPGAAWFVPVRVPLSDEADAVAAILPKLMATTGTDVTAYLLPSGIAQHTLQLTSTIPATSFGPTALRTDFDAPSEEDELFVTATGHRDLWMLRPTLTLAGYIAMLPTPITLPYVSDGRLALVDLDGDGDRDVIAGMVTPAGSAIAVVDNRTGEPVLLTTTMATVTHAFDPLADEAAMPDVPSAPQRFPLAVGDLDGDGAIEAVSPDAVFSGGAGSLVPAYRRATSAPWREAVITDVDRDGRLDVIVASADAGLDVLRNRPGGFTRVAIDTAGPVTQLRAGDFDGDGLGDVAFRENAGRDRVRVLFGAIGAFAPTIAVIGLPNVNRLEVGRFRDPRDLFDAIDDLVLVGWDGTRPGISFVGGSGDRRVRAPMMLSRGSHADIALGAAAGHFLTDDARPDLLALARDREGNRRLWLFAAAPDLAYRVDQALVVAPLGALATLAVQSMIPADVDGDDRDELVALGRDPAGATQLVIATLRGDAPPTIETLDPGVGEPLDLIAGDFDRDGRDELYITGATGLVRYRAGTIETLTTDARSACLAQLDADPELELAVVDNGGLSIRDGATLAIQHTVVGKTGSRVRAGDLDGDGVDDLVVGDGFAVTRLYSVPQVKR